MAVLVRGGLPADEAEQIVAEIPSVRAHLNFDLAMRSGAMIRHTQPLVSLSATAYASPWRLGRTNRL
jgi:hypothetical protein